MRRHSGAGDQAIVPHGQHQDRQLSETERQQMMREYRNNNGSMFSARQIFTRGQTLESLRTRLQRRVNKRPGGASSLTLQSHFFTQKKIKVLLYFDNKTEERILNAIAPEPERDSCLETVGCDFVAIPLTLPNREKITIDVWATSGIDRFKEISRSYYRGVNIIVTDPEHKAIFERSAGSVAPVMVATTLIKSDTPEKRIQEVLAAVLYSHLNPRKASIAADNGSAGYAGGHGVFTALQNLGVDDQEPGPGPAV